MVQGTLPLLRHRLRRHEDEKVVATHGNMKAEVNRGLNCVKGYFLSKILYGADLLTQPLLPMISARRGLNCVKGSFLSKIMYDADLLQPLLRMISARAGLALELRARYNLMLWTGLMDAGSARGRMISR